MPQNLTTLKKLRIPLYSHPSFIGFDSNVQPRPQNPVYKTIEIDVQQLNRRLQKEIAKHVYRTNQHSECLIVLGADVICSVSSNTSRDELYNLYVDLSEQQFLGYGLILNGQSNGVTFIPNMPKRFIQDRKKSERELMCQDHLEAVAKEIAAVGLANSDQYADGWFACLRSICNALDIKVPDHVPFSEMRSMSVEDILQKLREESLSTTA